MWICGSGDREIEDETERIDCKHVHQTRYEKKSSKIFNAIDYAIIKHI